MERSEALEKLKVIMKDIITDSNVDIDKINEDCNLIEDLGFDSLSLLMMAVQIEEEFSKSMQDMSSDTFVTVKDVLDYILK
jgi:acyl carrier protein